MIDNQEQLRTIIEAQHNCVFISTGEESYARQIVGDVAVELGLDLHLWTVIDGVRNGLVSQSPGVGGTEHAAAALLYLTSIQPRCLAVMLDLVEHLNDARTMRVFRDLLIHFERTGSTLIIIDYHDELPRPLNEIATRFTISLPDEEELQQIVRNTLREIHLRQPITIDITRKQLNTIIRNLRGVSRRQARQIITDVVIKDRTFDHHDINCVMAQKRQMLHADGLLEYVEAPAELDEIGGMKRLKRWLKQRQHAMAGDVTELGINAPRGVLMLGVQGAGKSLCAKAIATAWQLPLLRMDTGALYDKYIGESEKRLRRALHQAQVMAPIVLWIDEIEKAFASAASRSTDGGLSQRMFGTLLTWMQEHSEPVFVVATANEIDALPPELLRKGRFDEIFFVDLPGQKTRQTIFEIHLRRRKQDPSNFDLDQLAKCSEGFSGAEIEQVIIGGLHESISRNVPLNDEILIEVMKLSPPLSVTMAERVNDLRAWADGRCMPAD